MLTALVTGRLIADPERRTGASGKAFVKARLAAGTDDDSTLVGIVAFGSVADQLAALAKGATVAVAGRAKPTAWTGRDGELRCGMDVIADELLTAHHVRRRRAAMQPAQAPTPAARDDDLPPPDADWGRQ